MAPPRTFSDFSPGDQASLTRVITAEDVDLFAQLTGDNNPVHMDDGAARQFGAGGRVVHGMLTASFVSTVIGTLLPGPGALWISQAFKFRRPVRLNEEILASAQVARTSPGTKVLTLEIRIENSQGHVVLDGEAKVQVLSRVTDVTSPDASAKAAVVTGSSRGIGAAVAQRLASDGLKVAVNFRTDETGAAGVVDAIRSAGGTAEAVRADVSTEEGVRGLFEQATASLGQIDVLVNNAGGGPDPASLSSMSWEDVSRHLDSHLRSAFLCAGAFLPAMAERGFGRIVNVTSEAAFGAPTSNWGGYVIAKSAVNALTRCLAVEAGPKGVTINEVSPGMTDTDMVSDIPQRAKMTLAAQAPLRRLASPTDVAEVVAYLVGPAGSYVTGQTVHVSGGQFMS